MRKRLEAIEKNQTLVPKDMGKESTQPSHKAQQFLNSRQQLNTTGESTVKRVPIQIKASIQMQLPINLCITLHLYATSHPKANSLVYLSSPCWQMHT